MRSYPRSVSIVAAMALSVSVALGQSAADPTGHWEGSVQAPENEVKIEFDLTRNSKGDLSGTFAQPAQGVKGFPLSSVTLDDRKIRILLKAGPEPATFEGVLLPDGKSISGNMSQLGYTMPFSVTRTGDARIAPVPKNGPIGKELEGAWNGTLVSDGKSMRLMLKMANRPDGTAAGTVVSPDGSGIEIPIGIAQKARDLTIDVPSVGATFNGVLNAEGNELSGKWSQGSMVLPLTFRRAAR
jgi:hypothetical protein